MKGVWKKSNELLKKLVVFSYLEMGCENSFFFKSLLLQIFYDNEVN